MSESHQRPAAAVNPAVRLSVDDTFRFGCGPHVPCFTECCGKLELVLTPYDVLRLKMYRKICRSQVEILR